MFVRPLNFSKDTRQQRRQFVCMAMQYFRTLRRFVCPSIRVYCVTAVRHSFHSKFDDDLIGFHSDTQLRLLESAIVYISAYFSVFFNVYRCDSVYLSVYVCVCVSGVVEVYQYKQVLC